MAKKKIAIKYTARDFNSIKQSLVDYAKRYYPETYQDFNDASFGSLMLDTVSYVGDVLSYFVDYQANESFLETAFERQNIIRLSRQLGYNYENISTAAGEIQVYALIPANEIGLGPDPTYYPIIREGSTFSNKEGKNFILTEDIRFDNPANEIVVGRVDESTGIPTSYAVRASGKIISGQIEETRIEAGSYEKFKKLLIPDDDVVEIISVNDFEGNEYFQVDNLTQNIVYKTFANKGDNSDTAKEYLRPVAVPRRFTFEYDGENYFLQFGHGSEDDISLNPIADPSSVALKMQGRDYVTDVDIDPTRLGKTDTLGISPSDTTLIVEYRKNSNNNPNAAANTITNFVSLNIDFVNITNLNSTKLNLVRSSMEVTNIDPVIGSSVEQSNEEIKVRALAHFATQKRAVTDKDYEALIYSMPSKLGSISRCNIVLDSDSFKRNINAYVLGSDENSKLVTLNDTLKENLKIWISEYKMINDTIDILDAKIVNIGIEFEVVSDSNFNKGDIYRKCIETLSERYQKALQMGEPFYVTDVYYELNRINGVVDTRNVKLVNKIGSKYSSTSLNIETNMSADGRFLRCPDNVCYEVKFPTVDITGIVK
tara:strand:- start:607 stop:2400 length:1794 start_codon:yes stop_codon:yes gene_type:complete